MRRLRHRVRPNEDGFTLIELLIVIVILGVLAGIVVFAVSGINDKGDLSACKADVKTVQVASESYYAQNNGYANTVDGTAANTLVGSKLLRSAPLNTKYKIDYDNATGTVTGHLKADGSGTACQ